MKNQIGTLSISIAVIIAFFIAGSAYKYKFRTQETISVTGLAEKDFKSDLIVWGGSFSRSAIELKAAYASLKQDEQTIRNYLNSKGINNNDIVFSSVNMTKNYTRKFDDHGNEISAEFSGFTLSGNVTVESKEIEKVEALSREITELLENGIELNSYPPNYYYTKLNELKIDLLAQASSDAKKRAETIAKNSGSGLGSIMKADMGVFQITGKNTNEDYSFGGVFNTSSKMKTASVTLKVNYKVN
jgi:hypothetical protein